MSDEFRPERFFIASGFAAELDEAELDIAKIRHHEDGSAELVLEPRESESDFVRPRDALPESDVMGQFIAGCMRSGLGESVCIECGRPWLTRTPGLLCPVCNPSHVGYNPDGPLDRARWMTFWRSQLTGVLRARAADHQHRRRMLEHAEAVGFTVYPPNAHAAAIIRELSELPTALDESDQEWREGWTRGFDR